MLIRQGLILKTNLLPHGSKLCNKRLAIHAHAVARCSKPCHLRLPLFLPRFRSLFSLACCLFKSLTIVVKSVGDGLRDLSSSPFARFQHVPQLVELRLLNLSNLVDLCASLRGQFRLFRREVASQVKVYGCTLVLRVRCPCTSWSIC